MKKILIIGIAVIFTALAACKKDKDNNGTPEPTPQTPKDSTEKVMEIKTKFGNIYMWLYKETPLHRANFIKLTGDGYFDSTTFHRVVPNFVIQGGDPNTKDSDPGNDGNGGPGYTIPAEINSKFKHDFGAVGAARDNNPQKSSSGSQFYIVVDAAGEHGLDGNYTVFGKIIKGMDVAVTIAGQPRGTADRPNTNITMDVNILEKTKAELLAEFNFTP